MDNTQLTAIQERVAALADLDRIDTTYAYWKEAHEAIEQAPGDLRTLLAEVLLLRPLVMAVAVCPCRPDTGAVVSTSTITPARVAHAKALLADSTPFLDQIEAVIATLGRLDESLLAELGLLTEFTQARATLAHLFGLEAS